MVFLGAVSCDEEGGLVVVFGDGWGGLGEVCEAFSGDESADEEYGEVVVYADLLFDFLAFGCWFEFLGVYAVGDYADFCFVYAVVLDDFLG